MRVDGWLIAAAVLAVLAVIAWAFGFPAEVIGLLVGGGAASGVKRMKDRPEPTEAEDLANEVDEEIKSEQNPTDEELHEDFEELS